jgi:hypothetical protein
MTMDTAYTCDGCKKGPVSYEVRARDRWFELTLQTETLPYATYHACSPACVRTVVGKCIDLAALNAKRLDDVAAAARDKDAFVKGAQGPERRQ